MIENPKRCLDYLPHCNFLLSFINSAKEERKIQIQLKVGMFGFEENMRGMGTKIQPPKEKKYEVMWEGSHVMSSCLGVKKKDWSEIYWNVYKKKGWEIAEPRIKKGLCDPIFWSVFHASHCMESESIYSDQLS